MSLELSTTVRTLEIESIEATVGHRIGFSPDGNGGVVETHYGADGEVLARYLVFQRKRQLTGRQRTRKLWSKRGRR